MTHCIAVTRTDPRPQLTSTENQVKFGRVVYEICEKTDTKRQTDRHIHTDTLIAIFLTPTGGSKQRGAS